MASEPNRSERDYWDEVEEAFAAAIAAGETARTAVLDARCGGRAHLRADVEALLVAHAAAGAFIAPHTLAAAAGLAADDLRPGLDPGSRIGAFRVLERIAQGGMGDVYRAERVEGDFAQQVAIKLIAATLRGADPVRRFRSERQILASLHHPSIVSILDGGLTTDGQPYIAMEFVDGAPITDFCRSRGLSIEARLRLFQQVCAAVAFAHRHLVVHRDLKPANVLVTNEGHVKVLDFGVAKLLEPQAMTAQATVSTLGPLTPDYASPEQVRGLPVTTACDVYALGVMLYELLAGGRPYETSGKTIDEVIALVLEREPPRPSAMASTAADDARRLRGDLDAIVSRAMAKSPERRYASAEELKDDVERYLAGRPVEAREPSLFYVARKAIARHRAAFALTGVFLLLLAAAVVGALWQARVAAGERARAVQRFNDVRELAGSLIFRIHDEVAALPGSTPVRRSVIAEGLRFLERLERDAAGDSALLLELARAYLRIGQVQGRSSDANLGDIEGALRSVGRAREIAAALMSEGEPTFEVAETSANAHFDMALLLTDRDEPRRAEEVAAGLAVATDWHRREPNATRARDLLARAHFHAAMLEHPKGGLSHWLESNRLYALVLAEGPDDPGKLRNVALTEKYLGAVFYGADNMEEALLHYERALALDERRMRALPDNRQVQIDLALDIANVASVHERQGLTDRAIQAYHRSLELRQRVADAYPNDVYAQARLAYTHGDLGRLYVATHKLTEAREHAARAVTLSRPLVDTNHIDRLVHAVALQVLGDVERHTGRPDAACRLYGQSVDHFALVNEARMMATDRQSLAAAQQGLTACTEETLPVPPS